jgi:ABC-type uncharacterized transport system substrate-binding protein
VFICKCPADVDDKGGANDPKRNLVAKSFWRSPKLWIPASIAACAVVAQPALGHPHVRISVEVVVVIEKGAVQRLKHRWTFDATFRQSNFEEYDTNRNGILEPDELVPFQKLALETLKRFDSFTAVWTGAEKVPLAEPVLVTFDMQAAKPVYVFDVTPSKPVPVTGAGVALDVYDPTYFSAFDLPSVQAISIEARDSVCSASLVPPAGDSVQMRDYRAFASEFGARAAKTVTPRSIRISCEPTPQAPGQTDGRAQRVR